MKCCQQFKTDVNSIAKANFVATHHRHSHCLGNTVLVNTLLWVLPRGSPKCLIWNLYIAKTCGIWHILISWITLTCDCTQTKSHSQIFKSASLFCREWPCSVRESPMPWSHMLSFQMQNTAENKYGITQILKAKTQLLKKWHIFLNFTLSEIVSEALTSADVVDDW